MLLPQAERRAEIHFYLAKSLPYGPRLALSFLLMTIGLAIQIGLDGPPRGIGLLLVFAGVLLLLTKGYENKAEPEAASREWRPARSEEIQRIITINKEQKKWDQDLVDVTNGIGRVGILATAALCALAFVVFVLTQSGPSAERTAFLFINAPVMLIPFWITGVRSILKNDRLVVKSEMLLNIESAFNASGAKSGEVFQYQLQTAKARDGSGEIPTDVKAILMFHEGPPDFLGLQMQISINSVQGTDYPYFYCVLVARPAFGGLPVKPPPAPQGNWLTALAKGASGRARIVVEPKRENDVDIAVIRQQTTKNSGYHTNLAVATDIFTFTLGEARLLLRTTS
ncbi:MAG: hypothetical protein HY706_07660 [Candidatus Hydrogenedentes bacterium]|nr:hypothetical protein [Candidatus Hydrogenedentota bacterium]